MTLCWKTLKIILNDDFWNFVILSYGNKILGFDNSNEGYSQAYLRADIKKIVFANKGYGKIKYLESLEQLHNLSNLYEDLDLCDFFEEIDPKWSSLLQEDSYINDSTINTQVCLRSFIDVKIYS